MTEIVRGVGPTGVDIAYERFGERDSPPVLLVMGLGTQMLGWPDGFCEMLAGRGSGSTAPTSSAPRQLVAIAASGDRTAALRALSVPTLVIHGADDQLVGVSGGRATARAIPEAELLVLDGMGHDLPLALWAPITGAIVGLVQSAETLQRNGVRPR